MFRIYRMTPTAKLPTRATPGSAGFDITADEDILLEPGTRQLIATGWKIAIPPHIYARVAPRSGLAVRGIDVGAGVVDSDYRGEVRVLLINHSKEVHRVSMGDRIAQLVLEKIETPPWTEVSEEIALGQDTLRGEGGFGSTGN